MFTFNNEGNENAILGSKDYASSETQGQIVGARERLNGREKMARRKVKNGEKSSPFFTFLCAIFSVRLVFPLPPICPWVSEDEDCVNIK